MAGFRYLCTAASDDSTVREQLTQLGELLAIVSFLKLASDTRGLSIQSPLLHERAEALLRAVSGRRDRQWTDDIAAHGHFHLMSARSQLEKALSALRRGKLTGHVKVMTLLTGARSELERASALLGAAIFDASSCCAIHTNVEETNEKAFCLGA
ncbi:hypothetical protein [Pararhizobium arenae]|uniref:hypothetical protein n=1 Tax=Pararhizobium arenae TaxID=1856850 RepID=UPI00094B0D59|nr:hypothetical protein [Pararhizobium arenae]